VPAVATQRQKAHWSQKERSAGMSLSLASTKAKVWSGSEATSMAMWNGWSSLRSTCSTQHCAKL
ncbi:unnamed protein product, partial [Polarella glacialis]